MSLARQIGTRVYIAGMTLAAAGCLAFALSHWQSTEVARLVLYMAAAVLASSFKVSIPEGRLKFAHTLVSPGCEWDKEQAR